MLGFFSIYFRSKLWAENINRRDLLNRTALYRYNNCRVCAEHFESSMFKKHGSTLRLKPDAFPLLGASK